jgi:ABC-2 type transport system ATP-binding protein
MIQVENLVYEYPGTRALDNVGFNIPRGSITALVGPNGAGKTTLLRCLAALEQPLKGGIVIDGIDALEHPRTCHRVVGYLSDFFGLYEDLTVAQCLDYLARAHDLPPQGIPARIQQTAEALDIADRLHTRAGALSRGLRQRLAIAQALVHEPKVLLLDEPASGLDPEARHALSELLIRLQSRGMTLMVSSHILAELESYCTDMLVLRKGQVVDRTQLAEVTSKGEMIAVGLTAPSPELKTALASADGVSEISIEGDRALFRFAGDEQARRELLGVLMRKGLPICEFYVQRKNLQEAYLAMVDNHARGNRP